MCLCVDLYKSDTQGKQTHIYSTDTPSSFLEQGIYTFSKQCSPTACTHPSTTYKPSRKTKTASCTQLIYFGY
ncbi:hypothetical protein XELAEV_18035723mg [Xenopus laevis]|uniref:Uncharacterized protein n=1 Tax=Xenopus laevis TaxID=8355 RepID=A0A974HCC5_XENLA|nr:hypothetical protein XELAEV_18035723mg [Xenopus laevis]